MKTLRYILTTMLLFCFVSCADFLDRQPTYDYTNEGFYKNEESLIYGLAGVYESMYYSAFQENNETLPLYILLDHFTAMGIERSDNTSIGAGVVNTNNGIVKWAWKMPYTTIARANSILDGAKPYLDSYKDNGKRMIAEVKLAKAWSYFYLACFFGDAVIYKTTPLLSDYQKEKSKKEVLIAYALELVDEALSEPSLTFNTDPTANLGRMDRAVALGLKARIALNSGTVEHLKIARDATKLIIDHAGRSLNPDFENLFDKDGQLTNANNELMLQLMYSDQGSKKTHYVGLGHASRMYGQSGRFPTQMFVDQFECTDGKRIDESPLYNPKFPGKNRDKRLSWTIWMDGDTIIGNSGKKIEFVYDVYRDTTFSIVNNQLLKVLNRDVTGGVAPYGPVKSGVGYIWKKYLHSDKENVFQATNNIILMRYAEILLMYAEAKIELAELDASVYQAINQVRRRAGQPDVDMLVQGNQNKMRQLVRRERKVELMLEGLHLFDMRRWKIGDLENEAPTYGFPNAILSQNGMRIDVGGYQNATPDMVPNFKLSARHDLNDIPSYAAYANQVIGKDAQGKDILKLRSRDLKRSWDNKLYLWPVPQSELEQNKKLVQNSEY